jgi:CRISPR system Cascade subunit CasB
MMDGTDRDAGRTILGWWRRNIEDRQNGRARALAARLRRASPLAALAEAESHDLARSLDLRDGMRLSRLVVLLAEVRTDVSETLMRRLGGPEPLLSRLRFQRLMRASDDELPDALRRAIVAAERSCNVAALGADLLRWSDRTRGRWSFEYFRAETPESLSSGAPVTGDPSKETTE